MRHSANANTAANFSFQVHGNESQSLEEVEHDLLKCLSVKSGGSLSPSCVNTKSSLHASFFSPAFVIVSCSGGGGADAPVKGGLSICTLTHRRLPTASVELAQSLSDYSRPGGYCTCAPMRVVE